MKRFCLFLFAIFVCVSAKAHNIEWYVDGNVYTTTTCQAGDNVTPPTPPAKTGYTFQGWFSYTPIEYLESTGTQYIDTGYVPNGDLEIEIAFRSANALWVCGVARGVGRTDGFAIGGDKIRCGTQYVENITLNQLNVKYVVKVDKYGYVINGQNNNWPNTANFSLTNPIYLFWAQGSSYNKSGIIYYAKLYDNNSLVRDFIPVLDFDGVPCMYERVEGKFYYNAGTGNFIAGPVLTE